jgi:hypothetical protein
MYFPLSLPLLMLRIGADDPHHALAVDHFALVTHLFDGRSNFHFNLPAVTEQFFHGRDHAAITPPAPDHRA